MGHHKNLMTILDLNHIYQQGNLERFHRMLCHHILRLNKILMLGIVVANLLLLLDNGHPLLQ
jgi:hypothetical protein